MRYSVGYALSVLALRTFFAPFVRRRVRGAHHIPRNSAAILAPNHISHFDPPLLGISTKRQVDWMAMRELFTHPLGNTILRAIGSFPVQRDAIDLVAVRTAIQRLQNRRIVGVFPEGGLRTGPTSVLEGAPLKPGVAALAQMTRTPVIPAVIIGTDALYAPRQWLPFRRTRVWVAFGEPLPPPAQTGDKARARHEFEQLLGQTIRDLYHRTIREENIPADYLPQTPQKRKGRE
jgi:1-acyl-sn-glycerol-3-phosphate acyltransferase